MSDTTSSRSELTDQDRNIPPPLGTLSQGQERIGPQNCSATPASSWIKLNGSAACLDSRQICARRAIALTRRFWRAHKGKWCPVGLGGCTWDTAIEKILANQERRDEREKPSATLASSLSDRSAAYFGSRQICARRAIALTRRFWRAHKGKWCPVGLGGCTWDTAIEKILANQERRDEREKNGASSTRCAKRHGSLSHAAGQSLEPCAAEAIYAARTGVGASTANRHPLGNPDRLRARHHVSNRTYCGACVARRLGRVSFFPTRTDLKYAARWPHSTVGSRRRRRASAVGGPRHASRVQNLRPTTKKLLSHARTRRASGGRCAVHK